MSVAEFETNNLHTSHTYYPSEAYCNFYEIIKNSFQFMQIH